MLSQVASQSLLPAATAGSQKRLTDYSWPPGKPKFGFRSIQFGESFGKEGWYVRFHFQGSPVGLSLPCDEPEGKLCYMRPGTTPPISFERVKGGWLGRARIQSHEAQKNALLLLHLSDAGKASAAVWDPGKKVLYRLDAEALLSRPDSLLLAGSEASVGSAKDLPAPYQAHPLNFSYLRTLGDPLRHDWGRVTYRFASTGDHLEWRVDRKGAQGLKEIRLPFDGKTPPPAAIEGDKSFFSSWERGNGRWTSLQSLPIGGEGTGIASGADLRLTLYDNGFSVLTLEEEAPDGSKTLYRLRPEWLSNPSQRPGVLCKIKLTSGQKFDDFDFGRQVISESFGSPDFKFQPFPDLNVLGGVSI